MKIKVPLSLFSNIKIKVLLKLKPIEILLYSTNSLSINKQYALSLHIVTPLHNFIYLIVKIVPSPIKNKNIKLNLRRGTNTCGLVTLWSNWFPSEKNASKKIKEFARNEPTKSQNNEPDTKQKSEINKCSEQWTRQLPWTRRCRARWKVRLG